MTLTQCAEIASIISCLISMISLCISGLTLKFAISINTNTSKDEINVVEKSKIKDSKINMRNG